MGKKAIIASAQAATNVIGVTGYSTEDGRQLFNFNVSSTETQSYFFTSGEVDGKFAWFDQGTMKWYGYDALTGTQLWVTDPYSNRLGNVHLKCRWSRGIKSGYCIR